ncbi:ABC transporter permease [Roseomonas sp. 573]|uniref:ABC transporter permease n=2 Tax=Roseomonas haemaphysalidis TaxID=2768162 RepID=A0ABS3KP16_9PROT|nr:ABC transporter permease [Roseomonas haemaphysalidis]
MAHRDDLAQPMTEPAEDPTCTRDGDRLLLRGALTTERLGAVWDRVLREAQGAAAVDLSGVSALDTSGAALVLAAAGAGGRIEGGEQGVDAVLQRARAALEGPRPAPPGKGLSLVPALGAWGVGRVKAARDGLGFIGESLVLSLAVLRHPRRLRLADVLRHLDEAGLRAFPLAILLGTLIGVILAFQSSVAMRQFGAEMYIPALVGVTLIRELGPLIAAIILSGRTGSAYAAELGTMTVNEEVDALKIMGVEPVAMLVLPRLLAAMLVMPVLALVMNLAGLIGMGLVMASLGFSSSMVINQLQNWLNLGALAGGLGKSVVFGLAIAGIGCRAGLSAGRGPRAVGDAATAAVVGGIVSTVVLDGIFAVVFYRLGW